MNVVLCDPDEGALTAVQAHIRQAWPTLRALYAVTDAIPWDALTLDPNLESAVANADFIQENAPEREDFKIDLFSRIDAVAPAQTTIASSTSGLLISRPQSRRKIEQDTGRARQCEYM